MHVAMDDPRAAFESRLREYVAPLRPNPGALRRLLDATSVRAVAAGEHLHRAGDPVAASWLILTGVFRYYLVHRGVERTGQFFSPGMVFGVGGDVYSFDAVTAGSVLVIPIAAMQRAYDEDHALERFGRLNAELGFTGVRRRAANLLKLTAEERYDLLVRDRPEVARAVPLHVVASYLGVTPEALSRIRRRRTAAG